jgi:RimJ/RimL family protein N-acetyltransferase
MKISEAAYSRFRLARMVEAGNSIAESYTVIIPLMIARVSTMYEGTQVRLRRLEPEDTDVLLQNWNDYQLRQFFPKPFPKTQQEIQEFIASRSNGFAERYIFTYAIEEKSSGALVGFIDLANLNWLDRTAMIDNVVVFAEHRGKGLGKEAILLLLDFAFNIIGFHNVHLYVHRFNEKAIGLYEHIGFRKQGLLREAAYLNGRRDDVVIMDIIREEYVQTHGVLRK